MLRRPDTISFGDLTKRATFQQPFEERDADGMLVQRYDDQFTVWAHVRHLRGGETVMQSRMQSKSPVILTVRRSPDAERITSEWRAVIDGRVYEVREDWQPTDDRLYLEMLSEARA